MRSEMVPASPQGALLDGGGDAGRSDELSGDVMALFCEFAMSTR